MHPATFAILCLLSGLGFLVTLSKIGRGDLEGHGFRAWELFNFVAFPILVLALLVASCGHGF